MRALPRKREWECVCVCVCVREREREQGRGIIKFLSSEVFFLEFRFQVFCCLAFLSIPFFSKSKSRSRHSLLFKTSFNRPFAADLVLNVKHLNDFLTSKSTKISLSKSSRQTAHLLLFPQVQIDWTKILAHRGLFIIIWPRQDIVIRSSYRCPNHTLALQTFTNVRSFFFKKMGHSRPLFLYFSSFQYTVDSIQ